MENSTAIALTIVLLVVLGGAYIATRPSTNAGGLALGDAGTGAGGAAEGAQYITAGGAAVGSVLTGIASLYGATNRQAGGSSAGATK